jgi:hypothetical protein
MMFLTSLEEHRKLGAVSYQPFQQLRNECLWSERKGRIWAAHCNVPFKQLKTRVAF